MNLTKIQAFLDQTGMAETRFGREAVGDPRFVGDLRRGRTLRPKTADKVQKFMAEYTPDRLEPGA